MRVFCYRNLNRKGVIWSVKNKTTGLVVDRSPEVYLKDCKLKISEAGRQRVIKQQRKNVHAGVEGERLKRQPVCAGWRRVEYNPYVNSSFVYTDTKEPVGFARYVKLTETGCYVLV